jgi:hypothetical protein
MPNQVTISTVNGTPNYDIYVCDNTLTTCVYLTTLTPAQLPYTFNVPFPYNNLNPVFIRVVDSTGCIINELVSF